MRRVGEREMRMRMEAEMVRRAISSVVIAEELLVLQTQTGESIVLFATTGTKRLVQAKVGNPANLLLWSKNKII
jgi:hypothetical protein